MGVSAQLPSFRGLVAPSGSGETTPVGSDRRPDRFPDPLPRRWTRACRRDPTRRPLRRVQGSGRSSPTPLPTFDPRASIPPKSGPGKGRISPVFSPLRCKVVGGWGGSAHYPDPTAQSARRCSRETAATAHAATAARQPPSGQNLPKNAKLFLFSAVVESCALARGEQREVSSIRCANVSHCRPALRSARQCPGAEVLTDSRG